jgi:two-component system cell cycle response regulator DivK
VTILLVEDSEDNRGLIRQLVVDFMDLPLVEAVDGPEGLRLAREVKPAMILMDLSLPLMNGWELTATIKADPALAHIPIIALTAHAMEGDETRAREAGCDAFMTKPVDLDELEAMIASYVR